MKGRKVRIDQATAVHVKKTTNSAKVTANFKLVTGSQRAINGYILLIKKPYIQTS